MNCFPAHASISGSSSLPKLRVVPPIRLRGCFFTPCKRHPRAPSFPQNAHPSALQYTFPAYVSISGSSSLPKLRVVPPIRMRGCFFLSRASNISPRAPLFPQNVYSSALQYTFSAYAFMFGSSGLSKLRVVPPIRMRGRFLRRANSMSPRAPSFPQNAHSSALQYTFPAYAFISGRKTDYPEILRFRVLLPSPAYMLALRSAKKGRIFAP